MMRRLALIASVLLVVLTVSGCWDLREIENIAIVLAIGVDKAEPPDKYRLTVQIAVPRQTSAANAAPTAEPHPTNWVVTSTGRTVFEAVRNFAHQVPRRLFWSSLQVIVFGEDLAREGLHEVIDMFDRDPEPRRRAWMFIAKDVQAIDIMHTLIPISLVTAQGLDNFMMVAARSTNAIEPRTFHDFLQSLSAPGREPRASPIQLSMEQGTSPNQNRLPQGIIPTHHPRVGGTAVFRGDKLVGWLDEWQTQGLLFARGEAGSGGIVVPCGEEPGPSITIEMLHSSSSIRPVVQDGQLRASISVRAEGNIADQECNPRVDINELNERLAKAIERDTRSALDTLQKDLNSDVLGLGLTVHRNMPSVWRQVEHEWTSVFPDVPIDIDVKATVRRTGLITYPVEIR